MATSRQWAIVLVTVFGVCVLCVVSLIGLGVYAFVTHVDIDRVADDTDVAEQFETIRERFAKQTPLLTLSPDGSQVEVRAPFESSEVRPHTLHVMAWEPHEDHLVRLRLPFWLLRLGADGSVDLDLDDGTSVQLDLTVSDLDRHGPGLVVDFVAAAGERVLVWSE